MWAGLTFSHLPDVRKLQVLVHLIHHLISPETSHNRDDMVGHFITSVSGSESHLHSDNLIT